MTGVIYAVIIGLWAAVLIPIWLKRQDQVSEVRSTARFSSAMRSLGDRADSQQSHSARAVAHEREFVSPRDRARNQSAKRRSVVLATLTSVTALALIGTALGLISAVAAITSGLLLGAFLVAILLTTSKRGQRPAQIRTRSYREIHEVDESGDTRRQQRPPSRADLQRAEIEEFANWNPWDEEEPGWDAEPSTLPSYISAPRATAVPRNIERTGDWSGESMVNIVQQERNSRSEDLVREPVANVSDSTAEIPIIRANVTYQARAVNE
ncbi:MAG: hypothetical protein OSA11_08550 [Candidatus Nanopelagicales bacterium]|nr:hypothetical protein [Candidatus Nanopelagicales bacterium]